MAYNDYEGMNGFPKKKPMSRRTRYEMEVELIMMKKRLQADKSKTERLRQLQDKIQAKSFFFFKVSINFFKRMNSNF